MKYEFLVKWKEKSYNEDTGYWWKPRCRAVEAESAREAKSKVNVFSSNEYSIYDVKLVRSVSQEEEGYA